MAHEPFHYDLTRGATRKHLFGPLVEGLDNQQRATVAGIIRDISIPEEAQLANLAEVEKGIATTIASDWAKQQAIDVYRILAEAEAEVHGCSVDEVHFHEVGHGMTCREILGICTAMEFNAPSAVTSTPVQVGSGTVTCEHGELDVPTPATTAILKRYAIPVADEKLEGELCTPTSAALIAHFVEVFE